MQADRIAGSLRFDFILVTLKLDLEIALNV